MRFARVRGWKGLIAMFINFSYSELLQIASSLATIENVYGNGSTLELQEKIIGAMDYMDNAPITDVYPGVGTVIT